MRFSRSPAALAPLVLLLLLASCKGAEEVCNPTDPLCGGGGGGGGGGVQVASVIVTSSIDSVVAVGGPMATMSAEGRDASNDPVNVTLSWESLTPATATVSSTTGVVTAVAAGTTTIRASQNNNAVTGNYPLRAVDADLPAVGALLSEPFLQALRGELSSTPAGTVGSLIADCESKVTSGNVLAIDSCLNDLIAVSGANGNDDALLGVLDLFFALAQLQLQL